MTKGDRPPKAQWAARLTTAFAAAGHDVSTTAGREKLTDIFGVHQKTIESWTTGRTEPGFRQLLKVHEITGFSIDWILCVPDATPMRTKINK